jgi:hypothetical protein
MDVEQLKELLKEHLTINVREQQVYTGCMDSPFLYESCQKISLSFMGEEICSETL